MKVTLITHTPEPEKIIAAAAKLCYSPSAIDDLLLGLDDEKTAGFVDRLAALGHESPVEHVTFTFGIEGVSRSLLAQITRHRIASFSVQSQRYVKNTDFTYVTPPEIAALPEAAEIFEDSMEAALSAYNKLADILQQEHTARFIANGDDEKTALRKAEKKAIEDARFVLPNASETKMIATFNARSLMNFFRLRCCSRAQWEIRELAEQMLILCVSVAPTLFRNAGPSCVSGGCSEGKMSCGHADEISEKYKRLKAEAAQCQKESL